MKYAVGKMNNNDVAYIDPDHRWTTSGGILNTNLYYKDNLHLVEKGNEKLEKAITTAFNVGALKQQQNLPEIGQQHQKKLPQHQQKHHYQQQEGQQHREELQKHQKEQPKQKSKHHQHQIKRQLPQEEIQNHQEGQQRYQRQRKQHINEQLKQHQQQQQQQKQQHQQQKRDETRNSYTLNKIYSIIIAAKTCEDVKSSNTKYMRA